MTIRVLAASLILAIVFMLAPREISAGSGGLAAGPVPMHGALVRPSIARPAITVPRPLAGGAAARVAVPRAPFFRHRHPFRFPVVVAGGVPWYYYDTSGGYVAPYQPAPFDYPAAPYPFADAVPPRERIIYVMPARPGCTSQTQTVRSENGGERTITIVRC